MAHRMFMINIVQVAQYLLWLQLGWDHDIIDPASHTSGGLSEQMPFTLNTMYGHQFTKDVKF